jgi:hypothetical protein
LAVACVKVCGFQPPATAIKLEFGLDAVIPLLVFFPSVGSITIPYDHTAVARSVAMLKISVQNVFPLTDLFCQFYLIFSRATHVCGQRWLVSIDSLFYAQ